MTTRAKNKFTRNDILNMEGMANVLEYNWPTGFNQEFLFSNQNTGKSKKILYATSKRIHKHLANQNALKQNHDVICLEY